MSKNKRKISATPIAFIVVGLIMLIGGIIFSKVTYIPEDQRIYTTATVESIHYSHSSTSDTHTDIYVSYYNNDEKVYGTLTSSFGNYKVGKQIEVYYKAEKPFDLRDPRGDNIAIIVFPVFSSIFIIVGIVTLVSMKGGFKKGAKLKESCPPKSVKFLEIRTNLTISINNVHPYVIICVDGNKEYKSQNLWFDPYPILSNLNIEYFTVYEDEKGHYYLDVEEVINANSDQ